MSATETMAHPPVINRQAPVLLIPDVLEPVLRAELIAAHQAENEASGMHRMVDGEVKLVPDPSAKIRRDHTIGDGPLANTVMERLADRVLPRIYEAFAYRVTRLERLKVVAYQAATGGYFRPHRDNTTPDAAHRRFALTLNLNTGDYAGGHLRFPEYDDTALYAPPAGGACVFSCSLLHEATDVTAGERFALLTFFYGDAEAAGRQSAARRARR